MECTSLLFGAGVAVGIAVSVAVVYYMDSDI